MAKVIPAMAGFEVLYTDGDADAGFRAEPVIAWLVEQIAEDGGPVPITDSGSDVAIRYPDKTIFWNGRHYKDPSSWLHHVVQAAERKS